MVGAGTLLSVWRASRSIGMVRRAPPIWKCRRLHCVGSLLLRSGHDSRCLLVAHATGNRSRLGLIWNDLHGHCGGPHAVCASGSRFVELAANYSAGAFVGAGRRLSVLSGARSAPCPRVHVVLGSNPQTSSPCDLGDRMRSRFSGYICFVFLSRRRVLVWSAARKVSGSFLESFRHGRRLPPGGGTTGTN